MLNNETKHCLELYKQGRYNIISEKMIEVDSQTVIRQIKKGRTILTCSCQNHTNFCNSGAMCRHKEFFMIFPLIEFMDGKLSNIISEYEAGQSIMKTEEGKRLALQVTDDLKRLREMR